MDERRKSTSVDGAFHSEGKILITAPQPHPIWKINLQSEKPFMS
jgi:hypothetical protein